MTITFDSAIQLAEALGRAAAAHGEHETQTGVADADWQIWYSAYMDHEQNEYAPKPSES